MEEVMCPGVFGSSNGLPEMLNGFDLGSTTGRVDKGEGDGAVLIPPADTLWVGCAFRGKNPRGGKVDVSMELCCGCIEGADVGEGRCGDG